MFSVCGPFAFIGKKKIKYIKNMFKCFYKIMRNRIIAIWTQTAAAAVI